MKTKIAIILIFIYEVFAAGFVGMGIAPQYTCRGIEPIPPYATPLLFVASILLMIAACILLTKIRKAALWSCLILAFINLGILCWGIIYYFGIHCDGPHQITPDTGAAKLTIIATAIITLSLLLLLSDIKRLSRITTTENLKKPVSPLPEIIVSTIVYAIITITIYAAIGGVYATCGDAAYTAVKSEIKNGVAGYMQDSNHSSQLPIISNNATFTLTNPNGTYYIINMSALLIRNGGLMKTIPTGIVQLPGTNNDNCDGGATGCSNYSHYIWGMDNTGNVVSKPVNVYTSNETTQCNACNYCQCDSCDGYQGVWP